MGFFDELKSAAKSGSDEVRKTVRVEKLNLEISDLKRKENDAYAVIGRTAVALEGIQKFGENGQKLIDIQKEIDTKNAELTELQGESNTIKCAGCGETCDKSMKYCPRCGEQISE